MYSRRSIPFNRKLETLIIPNADRLTPDTFYSNGRDIVNVSQDHMLHLLSSDIVAASMHSTWRKEFLEVDDEIDRFDELIRFAYTKLYFSALLRFNKNPLHPSPLYYKELNNNRCYQQVISSPRKMRPRFSSSHALSLCVLCMCMSAVLYLNFCARARARARVCVCVCVCVCGYRWQRDKHTNCFSLSAFNLRLFSLITFSRNAFGTDIRFADSFALPSCENPAHFNHNELVRVSERKGEKVYLYSACEYLTNYRRGNCKKLLTKLEVAPVRFLIDDKTSRECLIEPILY